MSKQQVSGQCLSTGLCVVTLLALTVILAAIMLIPQSAAAAVTLSYFPPREGMEWKTLDPEAAGWNVAALDRAVAFAKSRDSTGLLIVQGGKIVAEHYWPVTASDAITRPRFYYFLSHGQTTQGWPIEDISSVQKSLVSVLVGMAVGKGLIDIDAPVSRYLGKGWSRAGASEQSILVRHLLAMDSGLDKYLEAKQPAGTHWRYNTPAYSRLVPLLEAVTHKNIEEVTREWLFSRIGMHDSRWIVRTGIWASPKANAVGLLTTPRDLTRLGLLVLTGGKWGEQDIVHNDHWFPLSLSSSQAMNPAYGFLWWLNGTAKHRKSVKADPPLRDGPLIPAAPPDLIIAMGHEKRRLYISPANKLVIVRFGSNPGPGFDDKLWQYISAAMPKSSK